MATIVTRAGKGSPLTSSELDQNQINLNTDKAELSGAVFTGAITTNSTIDGRDVATDGTKLDGIEASATADQTGAQIKTAYEAETNAFTDAQFTKLGGIEASADVTDTTNVTAAGALMDSEVTNLAQVKAFDSSDYATAAQGTTADAALSKSGGAMTGAITTNSTFDGRDVATDGTKLDGIEASADVTDTANVTAAGALMDSELTSIASVKALNQGVATGDSPTFAGLTTTSNVAITGGSYASVSSGSGRMYGSSVHGLVLQGSGTTRDFLLLDKNGDDRVYIDSTGIDVTGTATMDGLTVDNITIDGNEIDVSSGNLTLDVAGEIHLDSDSGIIRVRDAGGDYGMFQISSSDFIVRSMVQDKDLLFKGNDGGSTITALSLDMSAAGAATFNSTVTSTGLTANVPSGNGLLINSADISTIKMKANGGGVKNWGFAHTNLLAGDFGIYASNSNGGDPITAGAAKLYFTSTGAATFSSTIAATSATFTPSSGETVVISRDSAGPYFGNSSNNSLRIITNNATRINISNSGNISTHPPAGNHFVINEDGIDSDFRVESDSNTHALFVDGGTSKLGINKASPDGDVHLKQTGDIGNGNAVGIMLESGVGSQKWIVQSGLTGVSNSYFNIRDVTAGTNVLSFVNSSGAATFSSSVSTPTLSSPDGTGILTLANTGEAQFNRGIVVNEGSYDSDFRVESNNDSSALFVDGSDGTTTVRKLNLGVGGGLMGEGAISVGTSATNITSANDMGTLVIVAGNSSGAIFSDLVFFATTMGATVVTGGTVSGGPADRTYSVVASKLKLAMASGTYSVKATAFHGTL